MALVKEKSKEIKPKEKEKFSLKRFLITLGFVFFTAIFISSITYYSAHIYLGDKLMDKKGINKFDKKMRDDGYKSEKDARGGKDSSLIISSPEVVVNNLLTAYLGFFAENPALSKNTDYVDVFSSREVSSAFTSSFIRYASQLPLAMDPIVISQEVPDRGFTVGNATIDGSTARVPVTLSFSEGPVSRAFYLVLEDGQWKIDKVALGE